MSEGIKWREWAKRKAEREVKNLGFMTPGTMFALHKAGFSGDEVREIERNNSKEESE